MCLWQANCRSLLGAGVLGDGLGSLRHGVLGELTGQEKTDSGLDLSGGDGGTPVVVGKTEALAAMRPKMLFTKEFMMDMALLEIPVSGGTCFRTF